MTPSPLAAVNLILLTCLVQNVSSVFSEDDAIGKKISDLIENENALGALLINNVANKAQDGEDLHIDSKTVYKDGDLDNVIVISPASVPEKIVELYTSIDYLPHDADAICIFYKEATEDAEAILIGYAVEKPRGTYTKWVEYEGETPWLEWIKESFEWKGPASTVFPSVPSPGLIPDFSVKLYQRHDNLDQLNEWANTPFGGWATKTEFAGREIYYSTRTFTSGVATNELIFFTKNRDGKLSPFLAIPLVTRELEIEAEESRIVVKAFINSQLTPILAFTPEMLP